jgi:hypothetical protein
MNDAERQMAIKIEGDFPLGALSRKRRTNYVGKL